MEASHKTYPITWEEMHRDARILAHMLQERMGTIFSHIIAITKGGLIPATIIARELGIPHIEVIQAHSYGSGSLADEQTKRVVKIDPFDPRICQGDPLVIDDLVDSGDTLIAVRDAMEKAVAPYPHHIQFTTLYVKGLHPLLWTHQIASTRWFPSNRWLLMPWDMAPQFQAPLLTQSSPSETSS